MLEPLFLGEKKTKKNKKTKATCSLPVPVQSLIYYVYLFLLNKIKAGMIFFVKKDQAGQLLANLTLLGSVSPYICDAGLLTGGQQAVSR